MKNFVSVSTGAARHQDISLNPQKLAGMCAKLKCCLNYEVDDYIEHGKCLPSREVVLQTLDADYFLFKTDILAGLVTYSTDKRIAANLETITAERAKEVIEMNRHGEKPETLQPDDQPKEQKGPVDLLADGDIHRFDKSKKKKKKKGPRAQAEPADRPEKPVQQAEKTQPQAPEKAEPQVSDRQAAQPQGQPSHKKYKKKNPQEARNNGNEPKE
jgi:outer membrane biosynthesis protein TonB